MAFSSVSAGDILMLSQQAWRIGRAFTQGRHGAVAEFEEVEREASGLSEALKLTAETLYADDSILSRAESETRAAVYEIVDSAGRTLGDLESFVQRYQVIRRRETEGGWVVGKSWSEMILKHYKTIKWTTEGGDITELRDMLHVHTNTINLTMQALQSRSLSRLESTVVPMAENIASIHSRVNGDLGDKIDDLHRLVMSLSNGTPSLLARDRPIEDCHSSEYGRRSTASSAEFDIDSFEPEYQRKSSKRSTRNPSITSQQQQQQHDSVLSNSHSFEDRYSELQASTFVRPVAPSLRSKASTDPNLEAGNLSRWMGGVGGLAGDGSQPSLGSKSLADQTTSDHQSLGSVRPESTTLPNLFGTMSLDNEPPRTNVESYPRTKRAMSYEQAISPTSKSKTHALRLATGDTTNPSSKGSPSGSERQIPTTPSSTVRQRNGSRSYTDNSRSPRAQRSNSEHGHHAPSSPSTARASLPAFEKSLFRNAAILCDVRAKLVEYAQKVPDEPDPRYNVEMVEACKDCRIRVIRKRENRAHGGTKLVTSIWTIAEDGLIRLQQKLADTVETVPYCSSFEPEKVSISPTEEDEISLKFHGEHWTDELDKEAKTNWVNYIFVTEADANAFQSAVFGRLLIGSFRTTKSTVIHDGIMGTFAFEEQFANIETLRLWEEDGIATPGAQGGVLALMHISSNFGDGWARWWMNCSRQRVRLRDDPPKHARLKGIDVLVVKPGESTRKLSTTSELQRVNSSDSNIPARQASRRATVRRVTGIRIEFKTSEERARFVQLTSQAQERTLPLPDL